MVYYLILNSGEYWFQLLFLGELSQPGGQEKNVNWTKNEKMKKNHQNFNYKIYRKTLGWFAVVVTLVITIVKLSKPLTQRPILKNEYRQPTPILKPMIIYQLW